MHQAEKDLDKIWTDCVALFAEIGLFLVYDTIEIIVAEGNFVLTESSGDLGGPTAYYDLFRLEDGLIVEHSSVVSFGRFQHHQKTLLTPAMASSNCWCSITDINATK